jgi:hypothetical protein
VRRVAEMAAQGPDPPSSVAIYIFHLFLPKIQRLCRLSKESRHPSGSRQRTPKCRCRHRRHRRAVDAAERADRRRGGGGRPRRAGHQVPPPPSGTNRTRISPPHTNRTHISPSPGTNRTHRSSGPRVSAGSTSPSQSTPFALRLLGTLSLLGRISSTMFAPVRNKHTFIDLGPSSVTPPFSDCTDTLAARLYSTRRMLSRHPKS